MVLGEEGGVDFVKDFTGYAKLLGEEEGENGEAEKFLVWLELMLLFRLSELLLLVVDVAAALVL